MVKKYLPLAEMLRIERNGRGNSALGEATFIFDTNAFKYNYSGVPKKAFVTQGVIEELSRFPEHFPDRSVKQLADLLNPGVFEPLVSKENETAIYCASIRLPKDKRRRKNSGLGYVDTQQISHAIDIARGGQDVAIVSNDADFHNTVEVLRGMIPEVRDRVYCLSAKGYLRAAHKDILQGLNRHFRNFMLHELDGLYRAA